MESEILKKIKKIIREYSKLKKCFSTPIANDMLLVKIATRLSSYKFFHSFVVLVYSKKHKDILDFLKKDFNTFLSTYSYDFEKSNEQNGKKIFSLWLQGYENAPEIVQKAIQTQKEYAERFGYEYILLDESNLETFIEIPENIARKFEEGKIDAIKYSDIIRTFLLFKYGGIWFDATIYIKTDSKLNYLDNEFYTIRARGNETYPKYVSDGRWALFCIAGYRNGIIFDFLRRFQVEYFSKYDLPIDYFLIDYLMHLGYEYNPMIRKQIDKVITNNQDLYFLANHFSNLYRDEDWKKVLETTNIFKCSYKIDVYDKSDTYFYKFKNQTL